MTKLLSFCIKSLITSSFLLIISIQASFLSAQNEPLTTFFGCQNLCCLQHIDRDMHTYVGPPRYMASRASCSSFEFNYFGGPPAQEVQDGLQYAADIWACLLVSPVTIKVNVFYVAWQSLGTAIASPIKNFPGAPKSDIWYPYALADAITGVDQMPGEDDMTIFLDNSANWYFGLDGNVPAGQIDFVSVALHELGHGLGFTSLSNKRMLEGSFGDIRASDLMLPALPFPPLESRPGILDLQLIHGPSQLFLTDTAIFANPSQLLGDFFTGGDVFITGTNILLNNNNQTAEIYAPPAFAFGSSMTHLDEAVYAPGDTNSLMSPFIGNAEVEHHPGPIVLGLFKDLGWELCEDALHVEEEMIQTFHIYPNPVKEYLIIEWDEKLEENCTFELINTEGKVVVKEDISPHQQEFILQIDPSIAQGLYYFQVKNDALLSLQNGKILIQ